MDLQFTADEIAFRNEVRAFIRDNLPREIHDHMRRGYTARKQDTVAWHRILNARHWAAPSWPKEWGGPGWTPVQRMIFAEENLLAAAPEPWPANSNLMGPAVIQFGSERQKKRFLAPAANMDEFWSQGFSEPNAGSDLAALRTAAVRDGDDYVINGQKIWTTNAHWSDWCFAIVRTDPKAAKPQQGISFILIDMKSPGITIRPIISIDGYHHLNEVFFDDVRVPAWQLVGEENRGWDIAKFLLGNERIGIARLGRSRERLRFALEKARGQRSRGKPLIEDSGFRRRVAELEVELKALEITQLRLVSAHDKAHGDGKPDPLSSVLKIKGSELIQAASELVMDVGGPLSMPIWAQELEALTNSPEHPDWTTPSTALYLHLRAASIYGGSNEIQKNILAKAVLGL